MKKFCFKCKNTITDNEYYFSNKNFGKALCFTHQPTSEARLLGKKIEELGQWTVEYEFFDGHKNIDLSIPSAKVDIEVDGLQHALTKEQALADIKRNYYSYKERGFITLHVPNIVVRDKTTIDETARFINNFLEVNYNDVKESVFVRFFKGFFFN